MARRRDRLGDRAGGLTIGPTSPRHGRRRVLRWTLLALVGGLFVVRSFVAELVVVRGSTMAPNVLDGDVLLIDKRAHPEPGDVVLLEPGDGTAVLRRVLGVGGDQFRVVDGLLYRNGQPLAARATGAFTYRTGGGEDEPGVTRRQHALEEALEPGRVHAVLGDYLGAARPWLLDLPPVDVPPDAFFVLCDNRRICNVDEKAGAVPTAWVRGVARSILWYGDARAEPPPSRPFYGAFAPLASGGSTTGEPRK